MRKGEGIASSFSPGQMMHFPFAVSGEHPAVWVETAPRGAGAPIHRHPWAGLEYIAEGRVRYVVDGKDHVLNAGDFVYLPPNVPHGYVVESETYRAVGLAYPGAGFPALQRDAAPHFNAAGGPNMEEIMKLAASHHVEVLGPPPSI